MQAPLTSPLSTDDLRLVEQVLRGDLPPTPFGHREHVRVAWALVQLLPCAAAAEHLAAALRRFATSLGKPQAFHATITWALVVIIDERRRAQAGASWDEFAAANADLLAWTKDRSIMLDYYSAARLWSEDARAHVVFPDRKVP